MADLNTTAMRVQSALAEKGFANTIIELDSTARTAQDAANSIGCTVAQIAKSLVFKTKTTHQPVLVIASGVNRVDEKKIASVIGEPIEKADADFVREHTGFIIGGIPPLGHARELRTLIDEDLQQYAEIWAAGGTAHAVFKLTANELISMTGGQIADVKKV